ncbi:methyltransferase domain-containing protein [Anatilimnocola floriformis]|uniref:methyltransferase domain-containing protein n=1 Tax=Anatilimnocola floriformis TaxID=2948575 RepID=UPI0020C3EB3D|nr:methyltransferase domain-containing protein [Anatilimnocola floriformis]
MTLRKLHLGGKIRHSDWEVFARVPAPHVDHVGDPLDLSRFSSHEFSEIYFADLFEHFDYAAEAPQVLRECHRILIPGGKVYISVPDLDVLARIFVARDKLTFQERFLLMRMMFGGQVDNQDYHLAGWTSEFLEKYLRSASFVNIQRHPTFGLFRDASEVRFRGQLISLNVTAEAMPIATSKQLWIFGDSHSEYTFGGFPGVRIQRMDSVTMHRIGRDGLDVSSHAIAPGDRVLWCYGEVDCRCHVARQCEAGRGEEEILTTLVTNYLNALQRNADHFPRVQFGVVSVIPPARVELSRQDSTLPFVGDNSARSRFTQTLNRMLREMCAQRSFLYIDVWALFADAEGMLNYALSDGQVHAGDNSSALDLLHRTFFIGSECLLADRRPLSA